MRKPRAWMIPLAFGVGIAIAYVRSGGNPVEAVVSATQNVRPGLSPLNFDNPAPVQVDPQTAWSYFREIAFGAEFGSSSYLRRWEGVVFIGVYGSPTEEDKEALMRVAEELNFLANGTAEFVFAMTQAESDSAQIKILFDQKANFVLATDFPIAQPNYVDGNAGFFWTKDVSGNLQAADIFIAADSAYTQSERSHLIREELTQASGLMMDSELYPDSVFYQGWTSTTRYSDLDRAVIALLYDPRLRPGMTEEEAARALEIYQ